MLRKFFLMSLLCVGVSVTGLAYQRNKVASFKVSGGVAWTDYQHDYGDHGSMYPEYDPYRYERDYDSLSMDGAVNFGFSGEFFLRRRLAIGFSYKRNTADFRYKSTRRGRWTRNSDYSSNSNVSYLENGRRDVAFYMKAFLNRNFYIKSGLGYTTTPYQEVSSSYGTRTYSHNRSGMTLPFALGTEWSLGAFDFAFDWIGVNISLDRLAPTHIDSELHDAPLHEVSVGTVHLGVAI